MSTGSPILDNVIAGAILAVALWILAKVGQGLLHAREIFGRFNDRWGLRLARSELVHVRMLVSDRGEVISFTASRLFIWLVIFSVGLMFGWLALIGHTLFAAPFIFALVVLLYLVALHTYAVMHWSKQPEKYIPIIEQRVERLEKLLASSQLLKE